MPIWFFAALFATFLWAIVNLIDDSLLKNVYRSAQFGAVISGLFGFIPSYYLFVTNENLITDPKIVLPAVTAGVLTIVFYYYYFKTLENDEPSIAIALNNMAPAFVPFLAFIFLNEVLHIQQYIGLGVIVACAGLLALLDIKKFKFSNALGYAFKGAVVYSIISILAKYSYQFGNFKEVYVWLSFGFGVGGLSFLLLGKNKIKEYRKIFSKSTFAILIFLIGAEVINIAAEFSQGFAISEGPVSLVRGIEGTQPIFVLLIGILMQPFFPKHFRETKDKKFKNKLIIMLFMLFGLVLISIN